ncbi:MAG: pantoate--beta-alanine ligase [Candidatus Phaeomarinobacter sp.]
MLETIRTLTTLRESVARRRSVGKRIGLVPTMGALHDGHLTLVDIARREADDVAVSLFVNPTQFAPGEDLERYPRDEDGDRAKLESRGTSLLWAPDAKEMYPDGFATSIEVSGPSRGLETDHRPHFFGGVATVVAKLLLQVLPDIAVFGEKDYQQLQVIRRLVKDLDVPVRIVGGPTIREEDGLAMSSRNAYLSDSHRKIAPALKSILDETGKNVLETGNASKSEADAAEALASAGFDTVDYVAVRHADSLAPVTQSEIEDGTPLRVLAAAHLGTTRLIDNINPRAAS